MLCTPDGPGRLSFPQAILSPLSQRQPSTVAPAEALTPPWAPFLTGKKAVPKAYVVSVSPLRPNLVAVGANSGMAFMTFDRMYPLPVAAMPLRNIALAHVSPSRVGATEPAHAAYVAHIGDSVWHVITTAVEQVCAVRGAARLDEATGSACVLARGGLACCLCHHWLCRGRQPHSIQAHVLGLNRA